MKVLLQYTFRNLKNNKKTTFASMAAVLIASTLLFSLCSIFYNNIAWQADIERYESGGWHAEVGGQLTKEELEIIENNLQIDKIMIKGPFMSVQLPEESRLPYLLLRDADENYWSLMGEKNAITEGRAPEKPGEIVVSKSFFDNNPGFRLGDSFTLTAGHRMAGGELWDAGARMEGEQFLPEEKVTLTVVGKLDMTTPTTTPGYYAMGFLEHEALNDTDELVVYVTMKNIRDTYKVMPPLMEQLGFEKNEYGNYEIFTGVFVKLRESFLLCHACIAGGGRLCAHYTQRLRHVGQIKNQAAWHVPVCRGDAGTDPGVRAAGRDRGVTASHCCGNRPGAAFYSPHGAHLYRNSGRPYLFSVHASFFLGNRPDRSVCFLSYRTGIRFPACEKDG